MMVTMDPKKLDQPGAIWFPRRVTDLLHDEAMKADDHLGHRWGFCVACAETYTAINQAMNELEGQ